MDISIKRKLLKAKLSHCIQADRDNKLYAQEQ